MEIYYKTCLIPTRMIWTPLLSIYFIVLDCSYEHCTAEQLLSQEQSADHMIYAVIELMNGNSGSAHPWLWNTRFHKIVDIPSACDGFWSILLYIHCE